MISALTAAETVQFFYIIPQRAGVIPRHIIHAGRGFAKKKFCQKSRCLSDIKEIPLLGAWPHFHMAAL